MGVEQGGSKDNRQDRVGKRRTAAGWAVDNRQSGVRTGWEIPDSKNKLRRGRAY